MGNKSIDSDKYDSVELENGDFHYSKTELLNAINAISSADLLAATVKNTLLQVDIVADVSNYYLPYCPEIYGNIEEVNALTEYDIGCYETAVRDFIDVWKSIDEIGDNLAKVVKALVALDPSLKKEIEEFALKFTGTVYKAMRGHLISFDLGQFCDFVDQYLDYDVSGLELTDEELLYLKDLLEYGKDVRDYDEGTFFYQLGNDFGAFTASTVEGLIGVTEGIADAIFFVTGGIVSGVQYLFNEKEAAQYTLQTFRGYIAFDSSAMARQYMCDAMGLNQVSVDNEYIHSLGTMTGGMIGDVAVATIPGGWLLKAGLSTLNEAGKKIETLAQSDLTDQDYAELSARYMTITGTANVMLGYIKTMGPVTKLSDAHSRVFAQSLLTEMKGLNNIYTDYALASKTGKYDDDFGKYMFDDNLKGTIKTLGYEGIKQFTIQYKNLTTGRENQLIAGLDGRNDIVRSVGTVLDKLGGYEKKAQKYLKVTDAVMGTKLSKKASAFDLVYDTVDGIIAT